MIDLNLYFTFIVTAVLVVIIPGPSILFIIAKSLNLGIKGGLASVAGLSIGILCHATAVSLGLAQLLSSYPEYFVVVKNLGCIYLIYMGIKTFLTKDKHDFSSTNEENKDNPQEKTHTSSLIKQGIIVELLNAKTALFFLAFLPQFTTESNGNVYLQLLILGFTFAAIALLNDIFYAITAGHIGNFLKRSTTFRRIEKYFSGSLLCTLGIAGIFYKMPKS